LITGVSGTTLSITEIVPPASPIGIGGSVIQNIPGFTNAERQTLISASYQNILNGLTARIVTAAGTWNTVLTNQLTQLNLNIDVAAQTTIAKNAVQTAQTAYSTWLALANTGISGKYVDTSLTNLATAYNTRNSGITPRVTQITTALGVVTQDTKGNYSGNGLYVQRYKDINFLINTANGPIYRLTGVAAAKVIFEQKVANSADKLTTFTNIVKCSLFTQDSTGTTAIEVEQPTQFVATDVILVNGNDLPSIEATIVSIVGSIVTLDKTIQTDYGIASKASISKRV
jgi:hypothetical protein